MSVTYGQSLDLDDGKYIRNVRGSTGDPKLCRHSSWIALWSEKTKLPTPVFCCVCNEYKKGKIVGGHVILGADASNGMLSDTDDLSGSNRVFLAPICKKCNGKSVPMRVSIATKVLQLCDYGYEDTYPYVREPDPRTDVLDTADSDYLKESSASGASSVSGMGTPSAPAGASRPGFKSKKWQYDASDYEEQTESDSYSQDDPNDTEYKPSRWWSRRKK